MDLLGEPMLARQIERINRSRLINKLLVATSDDPSDSPLAELCERLHVECHRGSLDDVLDRFYQAAVTHDPDTIVRLTGDCPLADPQVIDNVIRAFLNSEADYLSNCLEPSFPDGLDVELFSFEALRSAWENGTLKSEREHVTPYITGHLEKFKLANYSNDQNLSHLRWTVDEPEDFEFVRAVYERLYERNPRFGMSDILALLESDPQLGRINTGFKRNEGLAKSLAEDEVLE